jgi:secondary thiamine-phosphate synthase enzyme
MVHQDKITVKTTGHGAMNDLTAKVQSVVSVSKVKTGLAHVFAVGSTAAIGVIEFEPGLQKDLPELLDRLMPPSRSYGHEQTWHDGNGHSHLQATLLGPSLSVPIAHGQLALGTWQQIFHIECDIHARERSIIVTVMGE